jgi:hypothetical protein
MIVVLALGVDAGWQKHRDGGWEYIIQIEPYLLDSLQAQPQEIVSEVPPFLRNVRVYRIRIGDDELPRKMPDESPVGEPSPPADAPPQSPDSRPPGPNENERALAANVQPVAPPAEHPLAEAQRQVVGFRNATAAAEVATSAGGSINSPLLANVQKAALPLFQARPWLIPLVIGLLLLSLAGNAFLAWIAWGQRLRFRASLRRLSRPAA